MNGKVRTDEPLMSDRKEITNIIADFWDKTTDAWRTIWGPHIHHGYYDDVSLTPLQAQERLIDKLVVMLDIKPHDKILDVGCGMGGSSLHLAKNFNVTVTGITLSQKQVVIATQQALTENIRNVTFKIEDALSLSNFKNDSIDIIWSLESCEQFFDKDLFIKQVLRVLKPGGRLMLATWCSDRDVYEGKIAQQYRDLCLAFDLPYMPTIESYRCLLEAANFKVTHALDWSNHVKKTWDVGVSLVNAHSFIKLIKMLGWRGFRVAKQVKMMRDAFHQNRVKYGVFLATKPAELINSTITNSR